MEQQCPHGMDVQLKGGTVFVQRCPVGEARGSQAGPQQQRQQQSLSTLSGMRGKPPAVLAHPPLRVAPPLSAACVPHQPRR